MMAETGWLIERDIGDGPEWFVGDNDLKFTKDASRAMRFARAQDAGLFHSQWMVQRAREIAGLRPTWVIKNVTFTEHCWS